MGVRTEKKRNKTKKEKVPSKEGQSTKRADGRQRLWQGAQRYFSLEHVDTYIGGVESGVSFSAKII